MSVDAGSTPMAMSISRKTFLTRLFVTALAVHLLLFLVAGTHALTIRGSFIRNLDGLYPAAVLAMASANHALHFALAWIWKTAVRREWMDTYLFIISSAATSVLAACGLIFFA